MALEFHHPDPRKKDGEVSGYTSWGKVVAELPAVMLVCANCHREIHDGLHPQHLVRPEDYDDGTDLWGALEDSQDSE